jgi:hypothetical protein
LTLDVTEMQCSPMKQQSLQLKKTWQDEIVDGKPQNKLGMMQSFSDT